MAGKIFGQFLSWIATDIIVKGLSNNRTFQRVVLKVDKFQTTAEKLAEEKAGEVMKMAQEGKEAATRIAKEQSAAATADSTQKMKEHAKAAGEAVKSKLPDGGPPPDATLHEQLQYLQRQLEQAQARGDFEAAGKLQHGLIPEMHQAIAEMNSQGINIGGVNVGSFMKNLKKEFSK